MTNSELKQKTIRGLYWNLTEKILVKGSSFIISIFLARILSPNDYGLIGMLIIFIALSQVFIESGFVKALIQKQNRTNIDYSTVFYFNLVIAILIYTLLFFTAPLIASFYKEPQLILILRILALNIIIGALNIVQRAQLTVNMDFKSMAKVNFMGTLTGGITGILMAYSGFGVWALVGQTLVAGFVTWIMFSFFTRWKPLLVFSYQSFKGLFSFGSKLLLSGIYATILNHANTIVIGKFYKTNQLGYYTRATQFAEIIAYTLYDVIGGVTFPMLSSIQEQREKMISIYARSLSMTAFFIFPVMTLFAVLAKPFVLITLTEKWLPCVVLLQILCFARAFTPLSAINLNILNAIGRSDLFLKADLMKLPILVIAMIITIPISIKAIVIGTLVYTFISFFINAYYPGKLFGYGAVAQIKDSYKFVISSGIMAI
ncbi:MAG: lipopolysaccharide biosynthesis protein, partial [Bacteroidales bacterium]|nr:lipopolysaccharide biosynthesis protein [Bacteroidales bacterium]